MAAILIFRELNQSGSKSVEQTFDYFFSNLIGVLDFYSKFIKIFQNIKTIF